MSISMHSASAPIFLKMLGNMLKWLDKAEAHATARKFDATNYLDLGTLPRDRTIHLQCGVLLDGELLTISDVVDLPPR